MKHTKGPWQVSAKHGENDFYVDNAQGRQIATTYSEELGDMREAQANAHLIAAAPEMLEALEQVKELLLAANVTLEHPASHPLVGALLAAEAALNKAKGGANE